MGLQINTNISRAEFAAQSQERQRGREQQHRSAVERTANPTPRRTTRQVSLISEDCAPDRRSQPGHLQQPGLPGSVIKTAGRD